MIIYYFISLFVYLFIIETVRYIHHKHMYLQYVTDRNKEGKAE